MTFEQIKRNYDRKLWNAAMVKVAVDKSIITKDEFKDIIGEKYTAA